MTVVASLCRRYKLCCIYLVVSYSSIPRLLDTEGGVVVAQRHTHSFEVLLLDHWQLLLGGVARHFVFQQRLRQGSLF